MAARRRRTIPRATRFRLRHGLQRDQQAFRSEHRPDGGPARLREGLPRRRRGRRTARRTGRTRRAVHRRQRGGRRGGAGLRPVRHAAVPGRSRRRRRVPGLRGRREVSEQRGAGGGVVRADATRQPRCERRPPGRGPDVCARPVFAARPLRPSAVRKPDRARRTARTLRYSGIAGAGARPEPGRRPAAC